MLVESAKCCRDRSLQILLHDGTTTLHVAVDLLNIATDLLEGGDAAAIVRRALIALRNISLYFVVPPQDLRKLERVEALFGLLDGLDDAAVLSSSLRSFIQAVCHVLIIPYTFTLPHFDLSELL